MRAALGASAKKTCVKHIAICLYVSISNIGQLLKDFM